MSSGTVVGGAALATIVGVTYYLNNQIIAPLKEDLEKTITEVYNIKKSTDIIQNNSKNITDIAQITKKHSIILNSIITTQNKMILSLIETIVDIQKKLYMRGISTKLIPKQYFKKENRENGAPKRRPPPQQQEISELDDL